jgi:hypothetical protein
MARINLLSLFLVMLLCMIVTATVSAQSISRIGNSPYPYSATPDTLFMVHLDALPQTQQVTVVTLQGLLARVKPQIMVARGSNSYIRDLSAQYGVTYDSTYFTDFRGLITHFKTRISGYILCNPNDSTTDAAISVCAMLNGITVLPADTTLMDSLGIARIYSTVDKGEIWSFDTFQNSYSKKVISIQGPAKSTFLSDYSVFAGAFDFYDWPTYTRALNIFSSIQVNGAVFGWMNENALVTATSEHGLHVHASDFSSNLCVYSNFSIPQQHQVNHTADTILRPAVHTVCFVMTDGDNIQWMGGGFLDEKVWYANPHRGEYNLGWTISPALAELGPTMMKHIYDSAATTTTGRDGFIAAPSGMGYSYPDVFSAPDSGAAITARMMQKSDLSILNVISNTYSPTYLEPYLNEPNIDAIFYYPYDGNYWLMHGFTDCINGKPVISARFNLVQPDFSTYSLAQAVNNMPKDPYSSDGYSLIAVNVWSSSVDSVIKCIQMLDSSVRVVTPESFVKLYKTANNCQSVGIPSITPGSDVALYNEPNPSTGHTDIIYTLPKESRVEAVLYDQYGQQVRALFADYSIAGNHRVSIDTRSLSPGLYYYTLRGDYFTLSRKCLVIK